MGEPAPHFPRLTTAMAMDPFTHYGSPVLAWQTLPVLLHDEEKGLRLLLLAAFQVGVRTVLMPVEVLLAGNGGGAQ